MLIDFVRDPLRFTYACELHVQAEHNVEILYSVCIDPKNRIVTLNSLHRDGKLKFPCVIICYHITIIMPQMS
ncbi:unnamed protein product [Onchocerca flexuosa]|uniref:MULE domain-containing protein n=1 Tax=Onchocerca flexuosa TaxID=387005 RepID=A0A183H3Q7_9BILA|nr:unnamed protein product [Onchocerca flexuosa]